MAHRITVAEESRQDVDTRNLTPAQLAADPAMTGTYVPASVVTGTGVDSTGATDSTAAIQALINALSPTKGGWLHFPPGRYLVSSLNIDRPVKVTGVTSAVYRDTGNGVTEGVDDILGGSRIICSTDGAHAVIFKAGSEGSVMSDITIEWAGTALPTSGTGVRMEMCSHTKMDRVQVLGFYDNIHWISGMWPSLTNSRIMNPVRYGLHITNLVTSDEGAAHIEGNLFYKGVYTLANGTQVTSPTNGTAVYWESGGGLRYLGNYINALTSSTKWKYGFWLDAADATNTGVINIAGNCFENIDTAGIRIGNASGTTKAGTISKVLITGNEISTFTSGAHCILIDPSLPTPVGPVKPVFGVNITGNYMATSGVGVGVSAGQCQNLSIGKNLLQCVYGVIINTGVVTWYADPQNYTDSSQGLTVNDDTQQNMGVIEDTMILASQAAGVTKQRAVFLPPSFTAGEIEIQVAGVVSGVGSAYRRKRFTFAYESSGTASVTQVEDVQVGVSSLIDVTCVPTGRSFSLSAVNGAATALSGNFTVKIRGRVYSYARS